MTKNENREVIKFSNDEIRVAAELMSKTYYKLQKLIDKFEVLNMADKVMNDENEIIMDSSYGTNGADGDGRPLMNGYKFYSIYNGAKEYISIMLSEDNKRLKSIISVAVNSGD